MAGAAVGVVASTAVVTRLQSKRLDAGGVLLHNALVGRDDPTSLTRQEVVDIGQRCAVQSLSGMRCSCGTGVTPSMTCNVLQQGV